jgi:hypothetical protein
MGPFEESVRGDDDDIGLCAGSAGDSEEESRLLMYFISNVLSLIRIYAITSLIASHFSDPRTFHRDFKYVRELGNDVHASHIPILTVTL